MSRRFRFILLTFAALIIGVFALRYVLVPAYGPAVLSHLLSRWRVSASDIRGLELVPAGMKISHAEFAWSAEQAGTPTISGKIENALVAGTIGSFREGRLSSASFDGLTLQIRAGSGSDKTEQKGGTENILEIVSKLFPPFDSVEINHFSLEWIDAEQGLTAHVEGRAAYDAGSLSFFPGATISFAGGAHKQIKMDLISILRLIQSADGRDVSIEPFSLRSAGLAWDTSLQCDSLELKTDRFLIMAQGASGKAVLKGQCSSPQHPEFKFGSFEAGTQVQFPAGSLLPRAEIELGMAKLEVGIPLSDLRVHVLLLPRGDSVLGSRISLQDASIGALGGTISASNVEFNLNDEQLETRLALKGIRLDEIFKIYPASKVSGSGILEGSLRLQLKNPGNSLTADGSIVARAPGGILKGDLSAWAQAHPDNQGIVFATRALQNFQYSSLTAGLEYSDAGQLLAQVEIKGFNPELNQGQPVNLNVGVEENLPALFKSMRLLSETPPGLEQIAD